MSVDETIDLLKQVEGSDIQVYTHGEMLPCLAYPELKKFKHLVGNYGGAWQDQRKEFAAFPGAILMTTNCIQQPKDGYKARIFTTGLVAWPGVEHVSHDDFGPVIEAVAGYLTGSLALLSDAGHMVSDVAALEAKLSQTDPAPQQTAENGN